MQGPGPEGDLWRAKLAYERGDYQAAIALLRPLLYPQALLPDEEQVVLAHKLLGLCAFFERDELRAEEEFNLLLQLRPDFTLDPLVDPLKAVAFVDGLRQRNKQRLEEIRRRQEAEADKRRRDEEEARRKAEEQRRREALRIYIERTVVHRLSPLHFVPFGVPQLREGRRTLGVLLAVGEGLTGAASIGAWLAVRLRYPTGTFPMGEYGTATALTATYLSTGAAFWGLVGAGLIEALWHARPEVRVRELPGPPPDLPPEQRKTQLRLLPLAPPGSSVGVELGGSF